jgi:peptidyl-prolyl cis-trans isomerase SurA
MNKFLTPLIMCAVLGAVVLPLRAASPMAAESAGASGAGEILEQVLVKVNGDIITKTDLEQRQVAVLRQRLNGQVDQAAMKNDEQLKKMLAEVTPELLVNAIDELLLLQRGRELGLHLGDDQFKQVVANIRKEQGLQDEEKFQKALQQEGMTMEDLRRQLERQMLIEQVQRQEVGSKLTITEAEAHQYYDRHPDDFTDSASITLREIQVDVPVAKGAQGQAGVNVAADEAGKKKIGEAHTRLLNGEDFAKVAAEISDSSSKANGGLIGPFSRDDMSPQLLELIDKMKPGDITPAMRTPRGYQVFKLEVFKPQTLQPFEKVRDLIADKVAGERTRTEMRKFLTRLRGQAIIEWKNDELKKAYEKQLAADEAGGTSGQ